ncbi:MAG: cell division protein SepF [Clostridiales bacterium]|jgi:cell division inhibitor SepF|nr:cell division protein SepF [Clostridiales bacterium]
MANLPKNNPFFNRNTQESELEFYEDSHAVKPRQKQAFSKTPAHAGSGVIIYEPRTPEDVEALIDRLKLSESAIVNLEKPPVEIAQRILDFLGGAVYAIGGSMSPIQKGANIFLLTPPGVAISAPFHE